MRWLQIGNFGPQYSTENYLAETIRRRGDAVECFQENDVGAWKEAIAQVADFDLVLWTRTPWDPKMPLNLQRLFLAEAAKAHVPTVGFHLDRWWGLAREKDVHTEPFFRVDLLCTADGGHEDEYAAAGVTHRWTPPAVAGWHAAPRGELREEYVSDVGFVGHWKNYHGEWPWRQRLVAWLQATYGERCQFHSGTLVDHDLNDAYVSMGVVVGDSCLSGGATRYWSNRIPETLGRGGLLIHPNVEGLAEHFTAGEHLLTFDLGDFGQLREMIDHYVEHPDEGQAIREAGRAHVLANHTFAVRLDQIVADLLHRGMLPASPLERVAGREGPVTVRVLETMIEFDLRPGSCDGDIVDEVWHDNVYRVPPGDVVGGLVLDVGANIGAFALWASAAGAEQVIAYEPEPANAAQLRRHVERNGAAIVVEEAAVTGRDLPARLSLVSAGLEGDAHLVASDEPGVDVAGVSLRTAIVSALAVNGHREVALLKIDTEGAEYDMLADLDDILPLVRRIALEFHGPWMHDQKAPGRELDEDTAQRFGLLVSQLAERGGVEIVGRPSIGGYLYWRRYDS